MIQFIYKRFLKILYLTFLVFTTPSNAQNDFNTKPFLNAANSIASTIAGQKMILKDEASLVGTKKISNEYLSALSLSKPRRFLKHTFGAENLNYNLYIWVIDVIYMSEKEAELAFREVHKISKTVSEKYDNIPNLTYSNAYMIRDKNRILWLNTGCLYSTKNHLELVEVFKKSLKHNIDESLICGSDDDKCNYSGSH